MRNAEDPKIPRYEEKELSHALLYLDDLLGIVRSLKENCRQVAVIVETFLLEECSAAELEQLREQLPTSSVSALTISTEGPSLKITLLKTVGHLTIVDADDPLSRGLAEGTLERLKYHRLPRFLRKASFILQMAPWFSLFIVVPLSQRGLFSGVISVGISIVLLVLCVVGGGIGLFGYGSAVLRLEKRAQQTYFVRNRDALMTGGILARMGGANCSSNQTYFPRGSTVRTTAAEFVGSTYARHGNGQVLEQRSSLRDGRSPPQADAGDESDLLILFVMRELVLSFRCLLRVGNVVELRPWMDRVQNAGIHAMTRFVRTLKQDLSAVEAAVTEPWSNGPVEGHINRLKTLKRQMYGRASLPLLRARLLPDPPQ